MAAAAQEGPNSGGGGKSNPSHHQLRKQEAPPLPRTEPWRRQAALSFLTNISLNRRLREGKGQLAVAAVSGLAMACALSSQLLRSSSGLITPAPATATAPGL